MNRNFWKGKKVFITGITGFKGSWLSMWLEFLGSKVTGYSLPAPTSPSLFESANVSKKINYIEGDVRNLAYLKSAIADIEPEIIIHMAAQPLVRYSYLHPVETYSTNVMGTVNLLEAVREIRCAKVVVIVTSDKCYENREWERGYRENDPMGGHDPYSSSKGCAELVISAYQKSYFFESSSIALASVRAGNVIGGGDWSEDRLVPDIIKGFAHGTPVIIRNPNAIRPWQHVLDPIQGYLKLTESLWENGTDFAGGWNFGPKENDAKPVSYMADMMTEVWGDNTRWELDNKSQQPHEAKYLKLDCSKANTLLKWKPKLNLNTALEWTVSWYRNFYQNTNMRDYTQKEIRTYVKL